MIVLKPDYYDKFKCIAGQCPDSCCIGWKISVDKESFYKYRKVKGRFGEYLNQNVSRERSKKLNDCYGKISLQKDRRCSFLDESNLCQIYINLGEEFLCDVCAQYPRKGKRIGDRYEKIMTISCPEVARLILRSENPISFTMIEEETDELDGLGVINKSINKELELFLWNVRMLLIDIAQLREIPTWKRIVFIKQISDKIQQQIQSQNNNDKIMATFMKYIQSDGARTSLDNIKIDRKLKNDFIESLLEFRMSMGTDNYKFVSFAKQMEEFFELVSEGKINIEEIEVEFSVYLETKEYMLEHYIVYYIYDNVMDVLWTKNLEREISMLALNYIFVKHFLLVEWYNQGKKLEVTSIINVIYSFSRAIEHNSKFQDALYAHMKEYKIDDLQCIATLVR